MMTQKYLLGITGPMIMALHPGTLCKLVLLCAFLAAGHDHIHDPRQAPEGEGTFQPQTLND